MHVVVTGGAGFIGSNVAAAYLRDGHRVTVLDALRRRGTERNLQWLHDLDNGRGRLVFVHGDTRDASLVRQVIGAPDVARVFHFAAQVAVTTSLTDPAEDLDINLHGTFNVLEAIRSSHPLRPPALFFTSTNKVYGSLPNRNVVEADTRYRFADPRLDQSGVDESEPLDFHSPYGCSKGAADQYVHDYARIYGLPTVVFRMSCIYGTRQFGNEDQGWLAHFLIAAATGLPLTIYGNGKQVRDMLFVEDLVHAFQAAAERIQTTAGRVYNIGGGPSNTVSIWRELGPRIEALAGHELRPAQGEWRPGDQPIYVSNTAAARRDFGWQPRVSVDEGMVRLWDWIQQNRALLLDAPAAVAPTAASAVEPKPRPAAATRRALAERAA